jgi:hypothetical protein
MSDEQGIIYESENCWPDLLDLQSTLRRLDPLRFSKTGTKAETKVAEDRVQTLSVEIFQDFRALYEWFRIVLPFCFSHGKHYHESARQVLKLAESFIGCKLNEDAFLAAASVNGLKTRESKFRPEDGESRLDFLTMKVPDFGRIEEARELWHRHVEQHKKRNEVFPERSQS